MQDMWISAFWFAGQRFCCRQNKQVWMIPGNVPLAGQNIIFNKKLQQSKRMHCNTVKFRKACGFRHHPNLSLRVIVNDDFVNSLNRNEDVASPYYEVWELSEQFLTT
jgi:hypothetical protein